MDELIKEFPELQWKLKPSLMTLKKKCENIIPEFMNDEDREAERKRRISALVEKYKDTSDSEYYKFGMNYYNLASKLLFCNNAFPCKSQACIRCSDVEKLDDMNRFLKELKYDYEYLVVTIDINSMVHCISDIANEVYEQYYTLLNSGGFEGVVFGCLTVEHHSFPDFTFFNHNFNPDGEYCIPQLRLLIQADPKQFEGLEEYLMKHESAHMYEQGEHVYNKVLRKYKFQSPEDATHFALDRTWYEYQCFMDSSQYVCKEIKTKLSLNILTNYLLRQDGVGNQIPAFFYRKDT